MILKLPVPPGGRHSKLKTKNEKIKITMQNEKLKTTNNKWLLWGLIGFTAILLVTAIILFLQLKKPAAPLPSPKPKPAASPQIPEVQQTTTENVCEVSFSVTELKCTGITLEPSGTTVVSEEKRKLTSQLTGGSGTYTHAWTVTTNKTNKGTLSSTTTNPTNWTAPDSLTKSQEWTIKDTVTDTSTTPQTASCEKTLSFTGLTACFDTCDNKAECETDLDCITVGGDKRCVNPNCTSETDCACPGIKKACFDKCESDNDCESSRRCMTIPNTNDRRCVNPSCISESDCSCEQAQVSPSPSPSATVITYASPSPKLVAQTKGGQPELPEAGIAGPAVLGVSAGLLMILLGLLF